jgi:threonine synthase
VAFSVPTGNFGNVLAAWAAMRMGLPVAQVDRGVEPQ